MNHLAFYFRYAFRNIQRGGRWTALAIVCIAAGVATIVALRSLGLAIGESLVSNIRIENKGDVRLIKDRDGESRMSLLLGSGEVFAFSDGEIAAVESYVAAQGGKVVGFVTGGGVQIAGVSNEGLFGTSQFVSTYLIDPATYPPTHEIRAIDPPGVPLAALFTGGPQIVISENMALNQHLSVGDTVRVARTDTPFTVIGIVNTSEESNIRNIFAAFFGFVYIDLDEARELIDPNIGINNLAIFFDEPLTPDNVEQVSSSLRGYATLTTHFVEVDTALDLLKNNEMISRLLGDFIVVMGLGALLIGGVGIMNTMLVLVRRRTNELAALKTFGLKGGQIGMLFLAEGLLLGLLGSVIGMIVGLLLSGMVNQYGEEFIKQELVWRIHPEALLYGFALGMVTSVIFGLVPLQTALRIRPAIILRPNENHVPRLGILRSLGLMLLITVLIGLVVGQIVQPSFGLVNSFRPGNFDPLTQLIVPLFGAEAALVLSPYLFSIIGVAITLLILGLLVVLLWIVVWLIGKFPAFGIVDLRLALRNLSTHRWRTATTLLALSAGMFALSSITFVGEGTRELLNFQLSRQFGGNVLAFAITPSNRTLFSLAETALNNALSDVPGIEQRTILGFYDAELVSVDGVAANEITNLNKDIEGFDPEAIAARMWDNFGIWDSTNPAVYDNAFNIVAGRNLTLADAGQSVMLGSEEGAQAIGARVESMLEYRMNGAIVSYELVGLYRQNGTFGGGSPIVPPDTVNGQNPQFQFYTYLVDEPYVGQAVAELSAVRLPPTIALDVGFFDSLIQRFIEQFGALPTIVGLLSLFAAAVIMANTVALATLERRRQIGILKSIGLKSWRVLVIMFIESIIVGLLSALLGIGLSWLFIKLLGSFSGTPLPLPLKAQLIAFLLVVAAIFISVISTFLSANVAVRERVMNVLRYE